MSIHRGTLALVVVSLVCGALAVVASASPSKRGAPTPGASTPVFSARRVPPLLIGGVGDPSLVAQLQSIVTDGPSDSCVDVVTAGRSVFSHQVDLPVAPASNMKLVTAQVALDVLGSGYRFTTKVVGPTVQGDTLAGNLTLVGGGDPVLGTAGYAAHFAEKPSVVTPLEQLADAIAAKGIKHVTGSIVGDESRYDSARDVPGWPARYLAQNQLGPLSALTVNGGLTAFPQTLTEANRTDVTATANPPLFAAQTFTDLLAAKGVQVDGSPQVGNAPAATGVVASVRSQPLTAIVQHMLTESDNQVAEMLVKELGHAKGSGGTTAAGVAVLKGDLGNLGVPTAGVAIHDGSGLDPDDRITCATITRLLERSGEHSAVGNGLAVAGKSGTLADRFTGPPVRGRIRAKTGTLNDVTALSGFADGVHGPSLTFAYVANGVIVGPRLLALQDRLAAALVNFGEGATLGTLGPT